MHWRDTGDALTYQVLVKTDQVTEKEIKHNANITIMSGITVAIQGSCYDQQC